MGMFDNLRCDVKVEGFDFSKPMQTKDTPNQYLDNYVITSSGRLVRLECDYIPDPLPIHDGMTSLEKYWAEHNSKKVEGSDREIDQNFHGNIEAEDFLFCFSLGNLFRIDKLNEKRDTDGSYFRNPVTIWESNPTKEIDTSYSNQLSTLIKMLDATDFNDAIEKLTLLIQSE